MENKKVFLVKDKYKVFIIEGDRKKIVFEGDFIAPPQGYYSIINSVKDISIFQNKNEFIYNYNIIDFIDFSFVMEIDQFNNTVFIFENFNMRNTNISTYLKSISHNFLSDIDITFTEPTLKYSNKYTYDYNLIKENLNNVEKIEITLKILLKSYNFLKEITLLFKYEKNDIFECIKTKKNKDKQLFVIFPIDVTYIIRKIFSSNILPISNVSYINLPTDYILNNMSDFHIDRTFNLSYYFDYNTNEYVVIETAKNFKNHIISVEHNILQSYLNYSPTEKITGFTREVRIPKNIFESEIYAIDKIVVTVNYEFNNYIYKEIYFFYKNCVYENIYSKILNNKYYSFIFDLNYNTRIINLRIIDGKWNEDGIHSTNLTSFNTKSYYIFGARTYENIYPSR